MLVLAGIFVDHDELSRSLIPDLAFNLLPSGGMVELAAVADIPEEHAEAVEMLRTEGASYSESSYSRRIPRGSGIPFTKSKEELVTSSVLLATIQRREWLLKMFETYDSRLYAWDFVLLGSKQNAASWRAVLERLLTQRETQVPRQLVDESDYLMITAQEHGAYLASNKLSRDRIHEVCEKMCQEKGLGLIVKTDQKAARTG